LLGGTNSELLNLLSPEQQQFLSKLLGSQTQNANNAFGNFFQQYSPSQYNDFYNESFVQPAQKVLAEQIIPQLKEALGQDQSSSGALNRALTQASSGVATGLGQNMLNQYNQSQTNRLGALNTFSGIGTARTQEPIVHQKSGILPAILSAVGQMYSPIPMKQYQ